MIIYLQLSAQLRTSSTRHETAHRPKQLQQNKGMRARRLGGLRRAYGLLRPPLISYSLSNHINHVKINLKSPELEQSNYDSVVVCTAFGIPTTRLLREKKILMSLHYATVAMRSCQPTDRKLCTVCAVSMIMINRSSYTDVIALLVQ
jgi:hypothetical protein